MKKAETLVMSQSTPQVLEFHTSVNFLAVTENSDWQWDPHNPMLIGCWGEADNSPTSSLEIVNGGAVPGL